MKRNHKYIKTHKTKLNHKGETVPVYKRVSANITTWAPGRDMVKVAEAKIIKSMNKRSNKILDWMNSQ